MNCHYDFQSAGELLNKIAEERSSQMHQLSTFNESDTINKTIRCIQLESSNMWKLIQDGLDGPEEVVLRIQGIICSKALPPISTLNHNHRVYMKQSLGLTGLSTKIFQQVVQRIEQIHQKFYQLFAQGTFEDWKFTQFGNHIAVDMANRYFTPRSQADPMDILPFPRSIDPKGILTTGIDEKYVYTQENQVDYYERVLLGEDTVRYDSIDPLRFRCGDIVEAQVSFVAVGLKGNRHKLLIILRALTLLDQSPNAAIALNQAHNHIVATVSLKRRVGYSNDETSMMQEGMKRMRIDED